MAAAVEVEVVEVEVEVTMIALIRAVHGPRLCSGQVAVEEEEGQKEEEEGAS